MRYVDARLEDSNRELAYRFYIAESLRNIPQQKYMQKTLKDVLYAKPKDNRSGDEIALDVIKKAGLTMI